MNAARPGDISIASLRAELWALRTAGAPMKERAAKLAQIDAAVRSQGPEAPAPHQVATCCAKAVVSHGCTCSYVTDCPEHGKRHHGTHD